MANQTLSSKEQNLFRQVVKFYEAKQYKKAIKAADQVLKKAPNHADTQAFKALTLNSLGQTDEAFTLAKLALKNNTKSHICWHVYGLLYRGAKNIDEAIKAYKFALKLEPESQQIARDLAYLQIQIRDYQGYIQSRRAMLNLRPQIRQNWTALAIAYHLAGELKQAENILKTFEDTLKQQPPKSDLEHAEALLYRNEIIAEDGDTERALENLESIANRIVDRNVVMELRANYLIKLERKEEAEKACRALLKRNNEYRLYYEQLEAVLGLDRAKTEDVQKLSNLYETFAREQRADAPRRIPLDFLEGQAFRSAADAYLRHMLSRGIPSTFANVKALYRDRQKLDTFQELVQSYLADSEANGHAGPDKSNGDVPVTQLKKFAIHFLAQHYNYHLSRDLEKAKSYISQSLELDPKSVDFKITEARIYKHSGDTQKAAEVMQGARLMDEKDRYINTKCAKYQLRNHENDAAVKTMSKFTRNETVGGPLGDLHDMQCMWFITEDGESHLRQGNFSLALKRFTAIADIFDVWVEDQFDFHGFSLRKGQVRAYVDMVRWEDHIKDHPFFTRAALNAIRIYLQLHDDPDVVTGGGLTKGIEGLDKMSEEDRKKAIKKARREQEKADKLEQERREAELKKSTSKKQTGGDGEPKKEDPDPRGLKLIDTKTPLADAMRFLGPLLEFSPKRVDVQLLGFEVFLRYEKPLLAFKCLHAVATIDPENPELHEQVVQFREYLDEKPPSDVTVKAALDEAMKSAGDLVPAASALKALNDKFFARHAKSAHHVRSALNVRSNLDPSSKAQNEKDLLATLDLDGADIKYTSDALGLMRTWTTDKQTIKSFLDKARAKWPDATIFKTQVL